MAHSLQTQMLDKGQEGLDTRMEAEGSALTEAQWAELAEKYQSKKDLYRYLTYHRKCHGLARCFCERIVQSTSSCRHTK